MTAPWLIEPAHARLMAALALRPRGLLSDVDGTLSPIAPTPAAARLLPGVRDLLVEALGAFDVVAAVSGRSALNARELVGVPELMYIGNHGLEWLEPGVAGGKPAPTLYPGAAAYVDAIQTTLEQIGVALAARFSGVRLEPKGVTASIHLRQASDPARAEEAAFALAREIAEPHGLRVTRGKFVVELRPPLAIDKGVAITALIAQHGLRSAIYLGDDRTDRDAFRALRKLRNEGVCEGVAIVISQDEMPPGLAEEADVALDSIAQTPELLRWLLLHARP